MNKGIIIAICCTISSVLFFQSCKKNKDEDKEEDKHPIFELVDTYFLGFEFENEKRRSYYYHNEVAYPLRAVSDVRVNPSDIAVASGDVYVTGTENEDDSFSYKPIRALLWKNGELQELTTPETRLEETNAVFVNGNDVYVAGSYIPAADNSKRIGVVWKNGEPVMVSDGKETTFFEDVFVSGEDIFAVGYENIGGGIVSKYWKNGESVTLSNRETTTYANSIFVDNADVYIAGFADALSDRSLKLWKNGQASSLLSSKPVVRGGTVVVENGHTYVCGYEQVGSKYEPRLFKDGIMQSLQDNNSGHTYAVDLKVYQGNMLVLGRMDSERATESILWVNGVPANIGNVGAGVSLVAFDIVPR